MADHSTSPGLFRSPKETSISGAGSANYEVITFPTIPNTHRNTPASINPGISTFNYSQLLSLPAEILENIASFLHPPEAICLSLTCRTLYYGTLSTENRYVWYLVGNFAYEVPGYNSKWEIQSQDTVAGNSHTKGGFIRRANLRGWSERRSSGYGSFGPSSVPRSYALDWGTTMSRGLSLGKLVPKLERLHQNLCIFSANVDYKGIIVDTMLGNTESGCQWCLRSPSTLEQAPLRGIKICRRCYLSWMQPWLSIYTNYGDSQFKILLETQSGVLGIEARKVPIVMSYIEPGIRFVWRPTVERLLREKYGPDATIDKVLQQRKYDSKASEYNKFFHSLFNSLKMEYRASARGTTTYIPDPTNLFRDLITKLTPEDLRPEWFFLSHPHSASQADIQMWLEYCEQDEVMVDVHQDPVLCKSRMWVLDVAKRKLGHIVSIFSNICGNNKTPSTWLTLHNVPKHVPLQKLGSGVWEFIIKWHVDRANTGGVQLLLERMNAANGGKGFECPWSSSALVCEGKYFPIVDHLIQHLSTHCFPMIVRGDTDWLVGKPSQYWLEGLLTVSPGKRRLVRYSAAEQQKEWLKKWWPERWESGHEEILRGWNQKKKFHFGNCVMRRGQKA